MLKEKRKNSVSQIGSFLERATHKLDMSTYDKRYFQKKNASTAGILVAAVVLYLLFSTIIDFDTLESLRDFPGGFVWFTQHFMPNEKAFEYLPKIGNALVLTLQDAIAAGTLGAFISYVLAVLGSQVTGIGGPVKLIIRVAATVLRNIPTVAWGFIMLISFKQAEFSGFLCLLFKSIGFCTRTFMETIDETDRGTLEALQATGATRMQVVFRGVIPLTVTQVVSWTLYRVETNFRDAVLVGMLTGTGIGFVFNWYYRTFEYPTAGLTIICIALAVTVVEMTSTYIRRCVDAASKRTESLRKTSQGNIKVFIWTKSSATTAALFAFLTAVTLYTIYNMDYGTANLNKAWSDLGKYFSLMFFSPHANTYSVQELLWSLLDTLSMAGLTVIGSFVVSFVLGVFAASNLSNRTLSNIIKIIMAIIRAIPTIVWVLVFTVAIGLGAESAIVGMMFHTVSFLTKAFSEAFEEVDKGVLDALRATGATWWQVITRGVFPDKLNEILSWSFIRFEQCFIDAVTVGAIAGSGGIGYQLYMVANFLFDWSELGLIVYLCLFVSTTLEAISSQLRKHFLVHK